jgi:hypothetical protein
MERAGRLIAKLQTAQRHFTPDDLVLAAWPAAVGKRLAGRTKAVSVARGRLVVEVEDELWRRNLSALRNQILRNFTDLLDAAAPTGIEFRIGIPRRPPQRENAAQPFSLSAPAARDEADSIADPGLRRIYINSRRKARAS